MSQIRKISFDPHAPEKMKVEVIEYNSEEGKKVQEVFKDYYKGGKTERAGIVPETADLGEYPHVCDALQVGDAYYVASARLSLEEDFEGNEIAISRFDSDWNQIAQTVTAAGDTFQRMSLSRLFQLDVSPDGIISLSLASPLQMKDYEVQTLNDHSVTFFYDQDLNLTGRLDNNASGPGTWLPDGRFLSFTQRMTTNADDQDGGIEDRTIFLAYDITGLDFSGATISGLVNKTYTGKAIKQKPVVKLDGKTMVAGKDYTVSYKNNVKVGTATVIIKGAGRYAGTKTATFKITKATPKISASTKTVKVKNVKKAAQTVSAITVKSAFGKVTYKRLSKSSKYLTVTKKGKIKVKKGTPKGTYKVRVKVTAAKSAGNNKKTKTVTVKIRVK